MRKETAREIALAVSGYWPATWGAERVMREDNCGWNAALDSAAFEAWHSFVKKEGELTQAAREATSAYFAFQAYISQVEGRATAEEAARAALDEALNIHAFLRDYVMKRSKI